jgi:hypothetical protein
MSADYRITPSPRTLASIAFALACVFATLRSCYATSCSSSTPFNVLTAQYDTLPDGYNSHETVITSSCLQGGTTVLTVPGWSPLQVEAPPSGFATNGVLAQPLYYPSISTGATNCNPCNLLVVANPSAGQVDFPGGTVEVTSASGSDALVWGLATVGSTPAGALFAYDATTLTLRWCTNSGCTSSPNITGFTTAKFALPTVVNGYAYIPTNGITALTTTSAICTSTSPCNGVAVYTGH